MTRTRFRTGRRTARRSAAVAIAAALAGCVVIPTPPVALDGPTADALERIRVGSSSRADVLLSLGSPDERLHDDRVFFYRWKRLRAVGALGAFPVAAPFGVTDTVQYALGFDDAGAVARIGTLSSFSREGLAADVAGWLGDAVPPSRVPETTAPRVVPMDRAGDAVDASFPAALWWFQQPPTFVHDAYDRLVAGRLEIRADRVVFHEPLPAGGVSSYDVRLDAVRLVAAVGPVGSPTSIALVRHDWSVERFTVTQSPGGAPDPRGLRAALDRLTANVQAVARP